MAANIVLIEDNPGDVQLVRMALNKAGVEYDLTVLDDGAAALELIAQQGADGIKPDLIVLDLNVPKYDGVEILEAMRRNPSFTDVRVAVLSSSCSPRERGKSEELGVDRYITKPLDLDGFLKIGETLRELLGPGRGMAKGC